MTESISGYFSTIYLSTTSFLAAFFSKFAVALVVMATGLIIAQLTYKLMGYLLRFINPMLRWKEHRDNTKQFISNITYWLIVLVFFYWAISSLGLPVVDTWLQAIDKFLPQIFIAILIVFAGYIVSRIVRATIIQVSSSATLRLTADLLAVFIITISILSALDQIDINASLINAVFLITFTLIFGGFILLLVASSHSIVKEMMCARFATDTYSIGQRISVGAYEGVIEVINSTSIHLNQGDATIILPANMLLEMPVTIISESDED